MVSKSVAFTLYIIDVTQWQGNTSPVHTLENLFGNNITFAVCLLSMKVSSTVAIQEVPAITIKICLRIGIFIGFVKTCTSLSDDVDKHADCHHCHTSGHQNVHNASSVSVIPSTF